MDKLKHAARLESYASYSEFIRRTALKEADKIFMQNINSNEDKEMRICR